MDDKKLNAGQRPNATPKQYPEMDNTMDGNGLDAAEGLALIGRMIGNTRNRMVRNAGRTYLVWGYSTVFTALAVWAATTYSDDIRWSCLWFMLPVLGWALLRLTRPENPEGSVRTFVDRVTEIIGLVTGFAALLVSTLSILLILPIPICFTILLMLGIMTAVNGLITRFTPGIACGTAGIVLAPVSLAAAGNWHMAIFITGFVVVLIVPGHILNYQSNHGAKTPQTKH